MTGWRRRCGRVPLPGLLLVPGFPGLTLVLALLAPAAVYAQETIPDTLRLSLADAVQMAMRQSRSVGVARAGVRGAEARVDERKAAYLPDVSAAVLKGARTMNTASFGLDFPTAPGQEPLFDPDGEIVGPIHMTDLRGSISQTLFDWSAWEWIRSARSSLEVSRLQEEAAGQRSAALAGAAYVRALGAQARLRAQETDLALAQELVGIAGEVLDAGVGVRLDLTRAEAQEAAMNARLIGARAAAERARLGLLQELDLPPETPLVLTDTLGVPGEGAPGQEDATRVALDERMDVRAAGQEVQAAGLATTAVRHERLPTLKFGLSDGWTGRDPDKVLNTYEWSLRVSVPVFTGFSNRAKIAEQEARTEALELRWEELQDQVAFQVRQALLDLEAADQQVEAVSRQLELAELEYEQARERFQEGVAGAGDVITAALRLNDARTLRADALTASQGARVALAAAQGRAAILK